MARKARLTVWFWFLILGTGLFSTGDSCAQELLGTTSVIMGAGNPTTPVLLTDLNGGAAVFAESGSGGTIVADPTLPAVFPSGLLLNAGFEYLRPVFPGRSVTLTVPTGINSNFTTLGGSGDVSFGFAFIPKFSADYPFKDLGFGVTASGELTSLSGHLTRTIDSAAGTANLTATSTVDLAVANLIEASVPLPLARFACFEGTRLEDTLVVGTVGTRYSHLSQDYNASLVSGTNSTTLAAHQDWDGFGLTTSLSFLHPIGDTYFFLYGSARGSFLLGTNNRNSDLTVTVAGNAAATTATKLTENKTNFVPIGEFEIGVAWGKPLSDARAQALAATQSGPLLWIKVGLIADIWGELGLLTPQSGAQGFSDSALYLFGFSVLAGVQF